MAIAHFTLATRDVAATRRFFEATFGWQALEHHTNVPAELEPAWLQIAPGQELHLLKTPDFKPSPFDREYGRHIALDHPAADFPDLKRRLAQHGAQLIDPLRETTFERFFFKDPNGYIFEVIAR